MHQPTHPPQKTTSSMLRWTLALLALGWVWSPHDAQAANCYQLYQKGKLAEAGACFGNEAKALGPANNIGQAKKFKKGVLLKNAIVLLSQASAKMSGEKANNVRINALELFDLYKKERLYGNNRSIFRQLSQLAAGMSRKVGFASLTILSNHNKANICVDAKGFNRCKKGPVWSLKLRAGSYQITIEYPLNPPVKQTKTIQLNPFQKSTQVFTPPVKRDGRITIVNGHPQARMLLSGTTLKTQKVQVGSFWSLTLPQGEYQLQILYPKSKPISKSFALKSGQSKVITQDPPPPPMLLVQSTPAGARVFIDGKYIGKTPLKQKMDVGSYNIELQKGCYLTGTKSLTLAGGEPAEIKLELKRDPVHLQWQTQKKVAKSRQALGLTALIAGAALGVGTGIAHVLATGQHSLAEDLRFKDFDKFQAHGNQGNILRGLGHTGVILTSVSAGFVAFGFITGSVPKEYRLPCKNKMELWRID